MCWCWFEPITADASNKYWWQIIMSADNGLKQELLMPWISTAGSALKKYWCVASYKYY